MSLGRPVAVGPVVIDEGEFGALMQGFAPFEPTPVLAVAVSGGPDSMALCLLADRWARSKGGRIEAFTVDHRLRPDSAAEARHVHRWLAKAGIAHRILVWRGAKPATGVPEAARAARYRLLVDAAAPRGILHLLLAHHRDDQAETLLLRLGRGSGVDGLSAMAGEIELPDLRLLRPLLAVPKSRLAATLRAMGQDWVEDPGNRTTATARGRVREALGLLARDGIAPGRLAATAARLGRARRALEQATADLLAQAVMIHPAGFLRLEATVLAAAPAELRLRALARCLMTISGNTYPPRLERLERLDRDLFGSSGRRGHTLHGCRIARSPDGWIVCREPAAVAPPQALKAGNSLLWDGRFRVRAAAAGLEVSALGEAGWREIADEAERRGVPRLAALALPALGDRSGLLAVPSLRWNRAEADRRAGLRPAKIFNHSAVFVPGAPLSPLAFAVAPPPGRTM